ncbi:MAG: DUF4173 domain-containing protein [Actinobacteria bacterium]|nr:DUF4173 domain-containing protein [Actinomycetota bacterium]
MRLLALIAAVIAAVTLPYSPLGVDVPLVATLVAATIAMGSSPSLDRVLFGALALALAAVPAVLDARWVTSIDIVAACLLAAVAVAGPRAISLAAPFSALDRLPELMPPLPLGSTAVLRGVVLGTVLVVPFGALFWSADAAFAHVAESTPLPSMSSLPGRLVIFALVLLGALGLALASRRSFWDLPFPSATFGLSEWAIPLVLLDLLFLAFVLVQVAVLFGGHDHVLQTAGLTYAEYARQGFWQLIVAAVLTFAVVAAAARVAHPRSAAERGLLRALAGSLCVLTIVIVASALHRLALYEEAFGLTRMRLAAETFSWALGGLFALLLLAGAFPALRRELARVAVAAAALGLLAFSLSNPDGRIAQRNVDRWRHTSNLDVSYLQGLSADAVLTLADLPEPLLSVVLAPLEARLAGDEPWSSANYSRRRARQLLDR